MDTSVVENEIINLQYDIHLKARARDEQFWALLDESKCIRKCDMHLKALFAAFLLHPDLLRLGWYFSVQNIIIIVVVIVVILYIGM